MSLTSDMLTALSGVGTIGTTLFEGVAPDTANTAVVVNQYAGDPPDATFDNAFTAERPGLQAMIRAPIYADGLALATLVMHTLGVLPNTSARSHPMYLGQDAKQRHLFSCNFNTYRL